MIKLMLVFITLGFIPSAHAYIDPGSGSFMLQMLIATFLGASFTIKMFFKNFKAKFYSFFCKKNKEPASQAQDLHNSTTEKSD